MTEPRRSSRVAARPTAPPPPTTTTTSASKAPTAPKRPLPTDAPAPSSKKPKPDPTPTTGALPLGSSLPALTLSVASSSSASSPLDTASLRKCVIFTYPKANTSGCTTQAKCYRDSYPDWQRLGYAVYGLSNDGVESLQRWSEKQRFPYELISDPKRRLVHALTGSAERTKRSHFVIDEEGKLVLSSVGVKPPESSAAALAFVKSKK